MTVNDNDQRPIIPDSGDDDGDRLLEMFFQEARAEVIADNGFSQRVMMRLPERQQWLSRLWTAACVVVAIVIFTVLGGWQWVFGGILKLFSTLPTTEHLLQLMVCGAVLTFLMAYELVQRERITFG